MRLLPLLIDRRSVWIAQAGRRSVQRYHRLNKARRRSRDRRQP